MYIGTSTVTSKGQITMPDKIRKKRGFKGGMQVIFIDTEAGVLVKKATDLKAIFEPFEEITKKEGLTRTKLAKEILTEKQHTLELLKK